MLRPRAFNSIPIIPVGKLRELRQTCLLRLKIICHGRHQFQSHIIRTISLIRSRVEKYRPNTLDDVSGHQDILATINRFVDANVCAENP